jgi:hypothetical protein
VAKSKKNQKVSIPVTDTVQVDTSSLPQPVLISLLEFKLRARKASTLQEVNDLLNGYQPEGLSKNDIEVLEEKRSFYEAKQYRFRCVELVRAARIKIGAMSRGSLTPAACLEFIESVVSELPPKAKVAEDLIEEYDQAKREREAYSTKRPAFRTTLGETVRASEITTEPAEKHEESVNA